MDNIFKVTADDEAKDLRVDRFLAQSFAEFSRVRIQHLIRLGCLECDGEIIFENDRKVTPGEEYSLFVPPATDPVPKAKEIPLSIIYEDEDVLVLNKAPGIVVHPAPGHFEDTIVNALLHHCADDLSGIGGVKRPGIVHRLDKDTSGIMIVAKNDLAHQNLTSQFQDRTLSRTYIALINGDITPKAGVINKPIARCPNNRQKMAVRPNGREAITQYNILEQFTQNGKILSLLKVRLMTGRTHQIRVHLSHLGHPLVGDQTYGYGPQIVPWHRQALHAMIIRFIHPRTKIAMSFEAPMAYDMNQLIEHLREKQ